ncbi:hypothetical protein ACFL53_05485, partial [Pseudomonadota bacterium]
MANDLDHGGDVQRYPDVCHVGLFVEDLVTFYFLTLPLFAETGFSISLAQISLYPQNSLMRYLRSRATCWLIVIMLKIMGAEEIITQ